jgi:hypothetical protein
MRRRVNRLVSLPTTRFDPAMASPKVAMKETTAVLEVTPNSDSASPGRMVRSIPIILPTNMLVATSRAIRRQLSEKPRLTCGLFELNPGKCFVMFMRF